MGIRRGVALALALLPWLCALPLPRVLVGKSLEQHVDAALPVAVGAATALSLLLNVALVSRSSSLFPLIGRGLFGLVAGTALFHVMIVLFGAPLELLIQRTALLALLLASSTTMPVAMHSGLEWNDWIDILLNARCQDDVETHVASVAITATLGAYLGALPIPLDWDRPWQQWPLTCVYGVLGGNTIGHATGVAIVLWTRKRKAE